MYRHKRKPFLRETPGRPELDVAKLQTIFQIPKIMNKILSFFNQSNRKKHLGGGFLVGLCAFGVWPAIYAAIVAASCLELKDYLYHNRWDWKD